MQMTYGCCLDAPLDPTRMALGSPTLTKSRVSGRRSSRNIQRRAANQPYQVNAIYEVLSSILVATTRAKYIVHCRHSDKISDH